MGRLQIVASADEELWRGPDIYALPSRVVPEVDEELLVSDCSPVPVHGCDRHELEACRGGLIQQLDARRRAGGGRVLSLFRLEWGGEGEMQGMAEGSVHVFRDGIVETQDKVSLDGPPRSQQGIFVEECELFLGEVSGRTA